MTFAVQQGLKYAGSHEWVRVEGEFAVIGISDYAQHELGDIVYVDLPKVGVILEQGKTLGSVESVKAVSDVYAPVSGVVLQVNEALAAAPETLNQDAHGAAWLVKLRLSSPDEIEALMTAAAYEEYLGSQV